MSQDCLVFVEKRKHIVEHLKHTNGIFLSLSFRMFDMFRAFLKIPNSREMNKKIYNTLL